MVLRLCVLCLSIILFFNSPAIAAGLFGKKEISFEQAKEKLQPHKAIYDINLVATRSGSPIINISGKMFYEWRQSCAGWIADHRFNLFYEYADGPAMRITSDFSTFETLTGKDFSFSAQRKRDDTLYQEFRGTAIIDNNKNIAKFTIPEDLKLELSEETNFPMTHTIKMIKHMMNKDKFFNAIVFDGSDDEGAVEINAFIGKEAKIDDALLKDKAIDKNLLKARAQNIRMAVFPIDSELSTSDYEMSIVFHENGVISDMLVDYDDFSITQKLVALEKIEPVSCQ